MRLSGPHSVAIAERLFRPSNGKPLSGQPGHTLILGRIFDADVLIDEALVSVMRSPRSYTAEDVVEVNCHGGIVAVRRTLELMLKAGARLAEPGEFTKRAFLNGRIDLAQAEAVADLIGAKTAAGMKAAANQLQGKLSERIVSLREKLAECLARLEATIDFPEDEVPELGAPGALAVVEETIHEIDALLSNAHGGKLYRDGVSTVIAGKPNVGKSSVLNAILNEPRAIVTEEPGTTRDVIVESLELRGIALRLSDTAGIREPGCEIERLGVERSERAIDDADLVLFVIDLTYPFSAEDNRIMERLASKTHVIVVANKADLDPHPDTSGIEKSFPGRRIIRTSATQGTGIKQLEDAIFKEVTEGAAIAPEEILVSRLRHQQALENARSALRSATRTIGNNLSPEFVAVDLREALDSLGEIVGAVLTDDILDRIFSEFCIGK